MCDWVGAVCVSVCSGVSVGVACADAGKVGHGPPALDLAATADPKDSISEGEKRVTIWNPFEKRKLSGAKLPICTRTAIYIAACLAQRPVRAELWAFTLR